MNNVITKLKEMSACIDAIEWIKQYNTFSEAWNNCERGDWMLWLIGRRIKNLKQRKVLVLCACQCARLSLKYVNKDEDRPRKAIETAEKWANNEKGITVQDVNNAAYAAAAAAAAAAANTANTAYAAYAAAAYAAANAAAYANAAYAATYAATYAANAAAYAANAAAYAAYAAYAAAYAAANAADAAAYAAYAADAAYAAYAAANAATRRKTLKKCANIVREFYPNYKF